MGLKYRRLVDLSATLGGPQITVLAGAPPVLFEAVHTHEEHGRSNTRLSYNVHTGTHVDCPRHFYPDGTPIDEVPLESYFGVGINLDLLPVATERTAITLDQVLEALPREAEVKGSIVVFNTGWMDRAGGKPNFYRDNPYLSIEVARWLVEQGAKAAALDTSVDEAPATPPSPGDSPIHRTLLGGGVMIIENLVNLDRLPPTGFTLMALPVKFYRGDGAPARAVAFID
jgi:arylformamidase